MTICVIEQQRMKGTPEKPLNCIRNCCMEFSCLRHCEKRFGCCVESLIINRIDLIDFSGLPWISGKVTSRNLLAGYMARFDAVVVCYSCHEGFSCLGK